MPSIPGGTPLDRLNKPNEVSERLGLPEKTLADWRSRGIGPAYVRLGRHVRYRDSDLERFLQEQTTQPRSA